MTTDGRTGESQEDLRGVRSVDANEMLGRIDDGGFWGGGDCPRLPSFTVFGHTFDISALPWWCEALAILAAVIYFFGAFWALQILLGD